MKLWQTDHGPADRWPTNIQANRTTNRRTWWLIGNCTFINRDYYHNRSNFLCRGERIDDSMNNWCTENSHNKLISIKKSLRKLRAQLKTQTLALVFVTKQFQLINDRLCKPETRSSSLAIFLRMSSKKCSIFCFPFLTFEVEDTLFRKRRWSKWLKVLNFLGSYRCCPWIEYAKFSFNLLEAGSVTYFTALIGNYDWLTNRSRNQPTYKNEDS